MISEDSFYKLCINVCVFMIFVDMAITVVGLLGVFPATIQNNYVNATETAKKYAGSGLENFISGNFAGLLIGGAATIGGLFIAVGFASRTGSWNVVAALLFGAFFWGSFTSSMSTLSYGGFFDSVSMLALLAMITVGMMFMFAGAIIGLFGGKE